MPDDDVSVADGSAPDYKALLEIEQAKSASLTAENERVGKDHSAMKGTMRSQTARDAAQDAKFAALDKKIGAIGNAAASGDASTLAESLSRADEETQLAVAQQTFATEYEELQGDLTEALGALTLDSPEATEIKALWKAAYEGTGMTDSARMRQFGKAARMAGKLEQPKAEEDEKEFPPGDADPVGTDTGPGSRGASPTGAALRAKDPRKMTPTEQQAHLKALHAEADKATGVKHKWE